MGSTATGAAEKANGVNTPLNAGGAGCLLSQDTDSKAAATDAKFGDIIKQIQAKYGEKPEKPREIKKTLGKDDFLRIMITQMKNQDPTSPFKAEQMATEIAQFTSVEQLQNVNQNLIKMTSQNRPLEQMAMTQLIGKVVTIDRERFPHAEGENQSLSFNLPKDAGSVTVNILNDMGEQIHQKDLGPQKAGEVSFVWDGSKANTLPAKGGNYIYRVAAVDSQGQIITINPQAQGRIIGVSFENTEPVFLVGDARHQDKITMRNIVRIEVDQQAQTGSGSLPGDVQQQKTTGSEKGATKMTHFIPFQKGAGSSEFAPNKLKAELPVAVPGAVPAATLPQVQKVEENGFPNGLQDLDQSKRGGDT